MYEIQETEIRGERIFKARFTGEFNRDVMFQLISEMADYEDKFPGNKVLADLTEIDKVAIDFNDMKSISSHVKENSKRTGKTAVVIGPDNARYLFAKLFIDLFNLFRPGQDKAFKFTEPAVDWLCPKNL